MGTRILSEVIEPMTTRLESLTTLESAVGIGLSRGESRYWGKRFVPPRDWKLRGADSSDQAAMVALGDDLVSVLGAVQANDGLCGRSMIAKILRGSRDKRLLSLGLDRPPHYGALAGMTLEQIGYLSDQMVSDSGNPSLS